MPLKLIEKGWYETRSGGYAHVILIHCMKGPYRAICDFYSKDGRRVMTKGCDEKGRVFNGSLSEYDVLRALPKAPWFASHMGYRKGLKMRMLDDLKEHMNHIAVTNEWEYNFITSLLERKEANPEYKLSPKQFDTLNKIHMKYVYSIRG